MQPNPEEPPTSPGGAGSSEAGISEAGSPETGWLTAIREGLLGTPRDFTSGNLLQGIVILAIPMVLEMAMESVFALCDVYFVSHLGEEAVATVGLTEAMLTIIYALGIGFSMATTAMVARRIGEKDGEGASEAARHSVMIAIAIGVLTGIPCAIFAPQLLSLMGAEAAVIEQGSGYTSILLGANVVIVLLFVNNAAFRGAGDATIAMRSLWLANGINIVLDPCLIFGWWIFPELGLEGAAIATTIGRGTGVLYQFWSLGRPRCRIRIPNPFSGIDLRLVRELLRLSVGGISQFLIATASWVVLMSIVADWKSSALAGYTFAIRLVMFFFLPAWGLSNAAATLVGQNLGANQPERAERSVWLTGLFNMIYLGLVTVLFVVFPEELLGFFVRNSGEASGGAMDPEVLAHGVEALRVFSYGYVLYSWALVFTQAFNGAGDTFTPTWMNLVCFWILEIPLAYLLAHPGGLGPSGVYWSVAISESLLAVLAFFVFRRGMWKKSQIAAT